MKIPRSKKLFFTTILAFAFTLGATEMIAQGDQVAKTDPVGIGSSVEPARANTTTPPAPAPASTNLSRVGIASGQPLSLSLDDAIRKALANNNTIEITRDDVRFQETQIRSILGFFDPVFTVSPTYTRNSTTGSSSATSDFSLNSGVTHNLRHGGGNYQAFFNNTRTENEFSQQQVTSGNLGSNGGNGGAVFSSQLGFRYNQPLFRNLKIDATRRNLRIARRRLEQTDVDFRRGTIEIIAQVQRTYWDLVFALRDQQNRQANLELSRENLRQVEARIQAGAAAPLSRWEIETELANRESDLLLATQQVSVTENNLKQLVLRDATAAEWSSSYVPTDRPALTLDAVNLEAAVKDAMENRYELRRLKLASDINQVDIAYFKNQTKPQVDLNSTFTLGGLALGGASTDPFVTRQFTGNDEALLNAINPVRVLNGLPIITNPSVTIPGTPTFLAGGFNRSLSNIFRSDAPNFSVGVTISFPFHNRTAKAELAGARVQANHLATEIRAQEQAVIVEVRNAAQGLETARQRVLSARRARENAEELLKGERALFDSGRSTTFLLFQRENSLTNARNQEIRAETDYNKALADLQRATSTTFQMNNIDVVSPTDNK
ncbi:MAG TPA: TolC family protein [Pyrinomonadaceae bacterium]|nr:TolC family protein [Pyrinomonadaceae bacterium]